MSLTISEPIQLRGPINGHIRIVSDAETDRVVIVVKTNRGTHAVDLVLLYQLHELPKEVSGQVQVIQRCAQLTAESMPRLKTMKDLDEFWIEINRLENAGDKDYRRILAKLFSGEYEALEVLKLKDVVDSLESAIDAFEKVANIVEQIAVKES